MTQLLRMTAAQTRLVNNFVRDEKRLKIFQQVRLLSYVHMCGKYSLIYKTVGGLLDDAAEKYGDKIALVASHQNQSITFREAKQKADEFAAGVLEFGLKRGDRVGLWAPNCVEWYIASFGLAKAGLISVYLNPFYQSREIQHCLNTVGVKMLITAQSFRTQNYIQILNDIAPEISTSPGGKLKIKDIPSLQSVVCITEDTIPGVIPFKAISESATDSARKKLEELNKVINPDEACNIQFTSGTTGAPKGAVLSHFHIVNNSYFMSRRQMFYEKDHSLCFMGPFFHAMGSVIAILTCVHDGTKLVVPEGSFSSTKAVQAIMKEKCSILLGTPTMYVDLVKKFQEQNLKPETLEVAITGGAFASKQLFLDMLLELGVKRVASVYGLTETGPITFMSKVTDDMEKSTTTVGYIMDHTEAKVVDENGQIVPWDSPGELWVRGYNIMKGYWDDVKKTKETINDDHWLKTGDQFAISKDGYGRVVGRIKNMIIRGGENIFPEDVEEYLSTHPDILEVQVVGVPDKRLGEQVCACIRLHPNSKLDEKAVKEFCKGKMASFKIPHYVYFVEKFPKTTSGKVQKYLLRAQAMSHLKISEDH